MRIIPKNKNPEHLCFWRINDAGNQSKYTFYITRNN